MLGDNPASDIKGANDFGWYSILLKTGVFQGGKPVYEPWHIADDVKEAVTFALRQEGILF